MKTGRNHSTSALALLAILALAAGVLVAPAVSASGGSATAAAKAKCKKKGKKAGAAGKKGKCKKKKPKPKPKPPAPVSLVRATLTWDTTVDFDLYVFDTAGNRGSPKLNAIPNSAFSADKLNDVGLGPETFTDTAYVKPGARNLSFGVCFADGGSNPTNFTLDYVTADGTHQIRTGNIGSDGGFQSFDGGAPIPANFCQT